ncbi:hypothetical protein CsSME_00026207 [Camellia sinensis var. sinensis]
MVSSNLGIDINGMISNDSVSAGYYVQGNSTMQSINLKSGNMIQGWIDYDSAKNELNVSLSLSLTKPSSSILTFQIDLSPIFEDTMYVGFFASIGGSFEVENKTNINGHNTQVVLLAGLMVMINTYIFLSLNSPPHESRLLGLTSDPSFLPFNYVKVSRNCEGMMMMKNVATLTIICMSTAPCLCLLLI